MGRRGGWGFEIFHNFFYRLAQLRALAKGSDAISLLFHKEMAKEREPRGLIPLGTLQNFFLSAPAARVGSVARDTG